MKIGEIKCVFLSCFNRGRSPFLTLGPSWPFTTVLIALGLVIFGYFFFMINMAADKASLLHTIWCYACISVNLLVMFQGILKNPGIP